MLQLSLYGTVMSIFLVAGVFIELVEPAPTYFTIWLNDGEKLKKNYLPQLLEQNERFGDVIIVDSSVRPVVNEHTRVELDVDVFKRAAVKYPEVLKELQSLERSYGLIKGNLPAAASDILRFVAFMGMEGQEFVYHDVDVKFGNKIYTKDLPKPFSSALAKEQAPNVWNHVSKNWLIKALFEPTKSINFESCHWNNDLIAVIPAECKDILIKYVKQSARYFEDMHLTRLTYNGDIMQTAMEVAIDKTIPRSRVYFVPRKITSMLFRGVSNREQLQSEGITAVTLRKTVTLSASILQLESILNEIFIENYYVSLDVDEDPDSPYAVAERHIKSTVLDLHGHNRGIFSFILDFAADPVELGAVSRKHNIDWLGEKTRIPDDIPTLDCEPIANIDQLFMTRKTDENAWYETYERFDDHDTYEEMQGEVTIEEIEANMESIAIDVDSPRQSPNSVLPSFECDTSGRRRRRRSSCPRDDESSYDIVDGVVLYKNKWHVHATQRYVIATDTEMYKTYKYTASPSVMRKIALLHGIVISKLEKFLRLPSGRYTSDEVNFKYTRLAASFPDATNLRRYIAGITPIGASMSESAKRFTRNSFGLGYLTSIAFNTQFLATALKGGRNIDMVHKIATGTIGSVGLAEMTYYTSNKLYTLIASAPIKYASVFSKVFKTFGVATAVYFGVESSIELSQNPENVEAWWWLSRSLTIFTPLNKYFIPIDISMIVTKRIVHASWDLSYKQNKLIMDYDELTNYHAMSFFGIETSQTVDIQNNAMFRSAIVNPTISRLAEYLRSTDAKGVVGFPVTTVCKTTNMVVYNDANNYVTDINSIQMTTLNTRIDTLSTARMQTCLNDARIMCDEENPSFWDWFISLFVRASRVRHRGADLGVGCTLLDGSILTGTACSRVNAIESDIADRKRIVIDGIPGNRHSLPLIHPRDYDFKFMSVSNGSITSTSTSSCEDMLLWSDDVAPYVLTNEHDQNRVNRFDYMGVPGGGTFKVNQGKRARVYLQKLIENNRVDNITVFGSADSANDFIVVDIADNWDVRGGNTINTLTLHSGSKLQVTPSNTVVDDRMTVSNVTYIDARQITNCTVYMQGNSTTALVVGDNSKVFVEEGAIAKDVYVIGSTIFDASSGSQSIVSFNGNNNVLLARSFSVVVATINGSASIDIRSGAVVHVNIENMTEGVVEADVLSELYIYGLTNSWNITDYMSDGIGINDAWKLKAPVAVLVLEDYHVLLRRHARSTVVLKNLDAKVPIFLGETETFVEHNDRILYYIQTSDFTVHEEFKEYMINGTVSLTIPYQSRKRIDFYGSGHVETNGMLTCGQQETCKLVAHYSCDKPENIVKVCMAA